MPDCLVTADSSREPVVKEGDARLRAREFAEAFGTPSEAATAVSAHGDSDDVRDLVERHHEALLGRVARLTRALEEGGDPSAEPVVIRALLADLSLVAASFRSRSSSALTALETAATQFSEARQAAAVYELPLDRTGS